MSNRFAAANAIVTEERPDDGRVCPILMGVLVLVARLEPERRRPRPRTPDQAASFCSRMLAVPAYRAVIANRNVAASRGRRTS